MMDSPVRLDSRVQTSAPFATSVAKIIMLSMVCTSSKQYSSVACRIVSRCFCSGSIFVKSQILMYCSWESASLLFVCRGVDAIQGYFCRSDISTHKHFLQRGTLGPKGHARFELSISKYVHLIIRTYHTLAMFNPIKVS